MLLFKTIKNYKSFFLKRFSSENKIETAWYFGGQSLVLIFGIIIVKIISQLGKVEYGKYALILTISALIGMTFYGPVTQSFNRFYYNYLDKNSFRHFFGLIYKFVIGVSVAILLTTIIILLLNFFFSLSAISSYFIFASGLFICSHKLNKYSTNLMNLVRQRKQNAILQVFEKGLTVISLIVFFNYLNLTLLNTLLCLSFFTLSFGIIKLVVVYKFNSPHLVNSKSITSAEKKELISTLKIYGIPFITWGVAAWLQLNGEKWIVAELLSTADVGVYSIMLAIANALIMVPSNFLSDFLNPIIFKQFSNEKDQAMVQQGMKYIKVQIFLIGILTVLFTLTTLFFSEELITLISNKSYTTYHSALPLLCLGTGLFYIGQAFTTFGMGLNRTKIYIFPKIATSIIAVISNVVFIIYMGIFGLLVSILLIGFVYNILIIRANKNLSITIHLNKSS